MNDALTRQRNQLNEIWRHGKPAEREEAREILVSLARETKLPVPLADPKESTLIPPSMTCLDHVHRTGTDAHKRLLADLLDDLAGRIQARRHRDITLI